MLKDMKNSKYHFQKVFDITQLNIEPSLLASQAYTLTTGPRSW